MTTSAPRPDPIAGTPVADTANKVPRPHTAMRTACGWLAFYLIVATAWILLADEWIEHGISARAPFAKLDDWTAWGLVVISAVFVFLPAHARAAMLRSQLGETPPFRYMIEMAPQLVAMIVDERITFINRAGARMLGARRPDALIGQKWSDFCPPDAKPRHATLKRRGGGEVTVDLLIVPVLSNDESFTLVEARDLTEIERTNRALHDSEQRIKGIVDTVADAIVTADETGAIQSFNPAAERIFGYPSWEVVGRNVNILLPEEMRDSHTRHIQAFHSNGGARAVGMGRELSGRRKDGSSFPLEVSLTELKHGDQRLFITVIRDITERTRAASRLLIAEKVLEATAEGVMVTDVKGTIVWVNNAFCAISGYGKDEVVGENAGLLRSGLQGPEFYTAMWAQIHRSGEWAGEIWNRRKNGEAFPEWLTIKAVTAANGRAKRYVGIFSDISKHKRAEERINDLTYFDPVTRLPNLVLFQDRLDQAIERASRVGRQLALAIISLDRFKTVNETLGHQTGDALLREVAERLTRAVRTEDTVARLRGDTFCCLLTDLDQAQDANPMIGRILDAFDTSFMLNDHELFVTASVGIGIHPLDATAGDELLQKAEAAMNRSKDKAENTYHFYTPEMNANSVERLQLETDLRKAVGRDQLELYYQPKVDTVTGRILGAEALVRWHHHDFGLMPPAMFIPMAEEAGLIVPIGTWVLRAACEQVKKWRSAGLTAVPVAVNLSAHQIRQPDLVEMVIRILDNSGIPPELLELEMTESAVMTNAESAIEALTRIHEHNISLAIDDFGTGYSSLSYLKRFPLDRLKIDRSFVNDLGSSAASEEIVGAIIAMAHSLNLLVIAEGVETDAQLEMLRRLKCDEIQGYYFSRPLNARDFGKLLKANKALVGTPAAVP